MLFILCQFVAAWSSVGCFEIPQVPSVLVKDRVASLCIQACSLRNVSFAAIGANCFCVNTLPPKFNTAECRSTCNDGYPCGGSNRVTIYSLAEEPPILPSPTQVVNQDTGTGYKVDQVRIAIIAGSCVGAVVVCALLFYFYRRYRKNNSASLLPKLPNQWLIQDILPYNPTNIYSVHRPYAPKQADEMEIDIGNVVALNHSLNNGWGSGKNMTTNKSGYFPLICLTDSNRELPSR